MADRVGNVQPLNPEHLALTYLAAKERVIRAGFADEIDWQHQVSLKTLDEQTFLRESAWVVLCAGFREAVLRRRFGDVSRAFLNWTSAELILTHREECRLGALKSFRNERKINAIVELVERVAAVGFERIRDKIASHGTEFLRGFPFIGPVTACHLAKNLGVPVVKPDRHLVRMALITGYDSPELMCRTISDVVGDPLSVIDIVFWRNATISASRVPEREQPCGIHRS